jgi:hypothetical protein
MDLLDRYLAAVAALLPKTQREDIVAELRDILLNQMEEKEAKLGRPLTARSARPCSRPSATRSPWRGGSAIRTLIGPELYPFYMFAVKVLLVLAAVVSAIPLVISTIIDPGGSAGGFARFLSGFLTTGMTLIGVATCWAYGIERGWIPRTASPDWKVADLPILDAPGRARFGQEGPVPSRASRRRFEALLEVPGPVHPVVDGPGHRSPWVHPWRPRRWSWSPRRSGRRCTGRSWPWRRCRWWRPGDPGPSRRGAGAGGAGHRRRPGGPGARRRPVATPGGWSWWRRARPAATPTSPACRRAGPQLPPDRRP